MANQALSANYLIRLEIRMAMSQEMSLSPVSPFIPEHYQGASLFRKYTEGRASSNAPFKLFEQHTNWVSTDEDCSPFSSKIRARGPYRKYTGEEKQEAVKCILNGEDVNSVSKRYRIPRRNLLRWKKYGCERKEGGGRSSDEEMEEIIMRKIKQGQLTDERQVRELAFNLSKAEHFKASKGWFNKFCQRNKIRLSGESNGQLLLGDFESTDLHLPQQL